MKRYIFIFYLLICNGLFSQENELYDKALTCFKIGDYYCAKKKFNNLKISSNYIIQSNANFYLAVISAKLYENNTNILFENFLNEYSQSEKYDNALAYYSDYLIKKRNYKSVVTLLNQDDLDLFSFENKIQSYFNRAYANFMLGNIDLAEKDFLIVLSDKNSSKFYDAAFYYACILLDKDDLKTSKKYFEIIQEADIYGNELPYYLSYIMFKNKDYQSVIEYLSERIDYSNLYNYEQLLLLNAKSYFGLKDYSNSVYFFEKYKNFSQKINEIELYELGFSYYKLADYNSAINNFNKIINMDNYVSQYAYYYLANSYLAVDKKIEAANAFKSSYDKFKIIENVLNDLSSAQLAESAYYNFALLCYDLENSLFDPISIFNDFIFQYPDSEYLPYVYSYLSNLYLSTSDYDNAVTFLEKNIDQKGVPAKVQKVSFIRGKQLFSDEDYDSAIKCFRKSISYPVSEELKQQASLCISEAFFLKNEFNNSITILNDLLLGDIDSSLKDKVFYNLAYSHNYLSNYEQSNNYLFKLLSNIYTALPASFNNNFTNTQIEILENSLNELKNNLSGYEDILDMIGDNYFHLTNYDEAISYYNLSVECNFPKSDYSLYKMATCLGITNKYNDRILVLNEIVNSFEESIYFDESMYELGLTYMITNDYESSKKIFKNIDANYNNSLFINDCKLKLAISYMKLDNNDLSILTLKDVIFSEIVPTSYKRDALQILKTIYESNYQIDEYMDFVETIPNYEFNKMELDSSLYYTAESVYLNKNYFESEKKFNQYLESFPNGLFYTESKFYLSKTLIELDKIDEAINHLEDILNQSNSMFTLNAIYLLADLYFINNDYLLSRNKYDLLIESSNDSNIILQSNLRLLEINYELKNYNDVIDMSNSLINSNELSRKDLIRISFFQAMSYFYSELFTPSITTFSWISENSSGQDQAKALYYMSFCYYKLKNYEQSKLLIFELANDLPSYDLWVSKALILLAKNYIKEEDFFQAKYVLEELMNKYDDKEILNEATVLLNSINNE